MRRCFELHEIAGSDGDQYGRSGIPNATNIWKWTLKRVIVAVAARSGATRVLSEDLNPAQVIAGVMIQNPFATKDG